jgi:hypothetical protein
VATEGVAVTIRIDYLVLSLLSYATGTPAETLAADRTLLGQAAARAIRHFAHRIREYGRLP